MKIRTTLVIVAVFCIVLVALLWIDRSWFPLLFGSKRISTSQEIFEGLRTLKSLHTLRYIQKVVFPYDYLDPELDFDVILTTLRRGKGSVNSLLSPRERDYLEARELAERIGLKVTGRRREFVVVTAQIEVGIDLEKLQIFPLSERSLRLLLPAPRIVDLLIEDPNPSTYPYPDIPLSPSRWKLIADLVERKLRERPLDASILATARTQVTRFLMSFLTQAGFRDIEIKEDPPAEDAIRR